MMRLTQAFALANQNPLQHAYKRIVTAAAKFWVAKRSIELSAEAMEVFGGNGYMDESPMGRLYREAPVISIWEGSGNVMALDMLRAISRDPEAMAALIEDLRPVCADDARLRPHLEASAAILGADGAALEAVARREAQRLILLMQARLLREDSPDFVADAFIASRFDAQWGRVFGTLPEHDAQARLLERAWPV